MVRAVPGLATTPVSSSLFMSFLHRCATGVRVLGRGTSAGGDAYHRGATAGVPQCADAGVTEPEPGATYHHRPGLAVAQLHLYAAADDDAERVVPLRRDHRDSRATAQRERPHRDYSVPSAGRRSGSPSRGNWSAWNVTISVIAPPVKRRTSIVRGRYAPSD